METLLAILIPALIQVESSGNVNVKNGDNGRASGILQIHEGYWKDGTKALGVDWPYSDAKDPQKAKSVCKAYLTHYGKHYEMWSGQKVTLKVLSRIHNGGPSGWKKRETVKYWEKVKEAMK